MQQRVAHFDRGSLVIIVVTLVLFVVALFEKGFTHDILLEAGVFLVSVKLIVQSYKSSVAYEEVLAQLGAIKDLISKGDGRA